MYDVLCIGQTFCDLIFTKMEDFPALGKEVKSTDFLIKAGGAANTPVALSRLGVKTLYCSILGNDIPGTFIYNYLSKTGMDMSGVIMDGVLRTSVSAVLSLGEERGFATYFAPCDLVKMEREIEKHARQSLHIHAYMDDCLKLPIVEIAAKYGRTLSVDTAWDDKIRLKDISHIIEGCSVFMTNEIESMSITGADTAEEALKAIGRHARIAVVKMGKKGSLVKQNDRIIHIPAISGVEAVDSTGAGDLYGAGFIYGFVKQWDIENCVKFATASGNLAVTFYGGMDESYTLENIEHFYNLLK